MKKVHQRKTPFYVWDLLLSVFTGLIIIFLLSNILNIPVFSGRTTSEKLIIVVSVSLICFFLILTRLVVFHFHKLKFSHHQCLVAINNIKNQGLEIGFYNDSKYLLAKKNMALSYSVDVLKGHGLTVVLLDGAMEPVTHLNICDRNGKLIKSKKVTLTDVLTTTTPDCSECG